MMNMKKKILGFALIAMLAVLPAVAKDNSAKDAKKDAPCCTKTDCKKEGPKALNPFEGLNLTEAQKTKLAELRKNRAEQAKANKEQAKADKDKAKSENRQARQNGKRDFLKEVKAILTPEQYVQFLENEFVNQGPRHNFNKKDQKGPRDGKQHKGQRPDRAPRQQNQPK